MPVCLVVLLVCARDAAANCQNGSTVQAVGAGSNLSTILAASHPPCTLNVAPGTYSSAAEFQITEGITLRSTGGPGVTTLSSGNFTAVAIWPAGQNPATGSCPSGAVVDGFTLVGPSGGVFVGANFPGGAGPFHQGCGNNQISGVILRNLIINFTVSPGGHGIEFWDVQNSVIDSSTIVDAYGNGIFIHGGSNNNIVMNNTVQHTQTQHAIAVQTSNDNVIVGNIVSSAAFDGILLNSGVSLAGPGSLRNRVERNTVSGHTYDGITLDQASHFNYVGVNTAANPQPNAVHAGVGVWVNDASNGNYIFGNNLSGSPENGIDVLTSRSTYLQGNVVYGNSAGALWVANWHDVTEDPNAPPPQDTVIHNNNFFFNAQSAQIYLQAAFSSEAAYNYLSGALSPQSGTLASTNTTGFRFLDSGSPVAFENTVNAVNARAYVQGSTSGAVLFRNRFLRGSNQELTNGLSGLTYSLAPAQVQWDGGSFLGGNHWSEFTAPTQNPDPSHPYYGFVGNSGNGPYVDHAPYKSESLQTSSVLNSMTVVEPIAGSVLAAGTKKTIRWIGRGCTLVDLYYGNSFNALTPIATGYPNVGFYFWQVPAVPSPPAGNYFVHVVCADLNDQSLGVTGNSPAFTLASSELVLLNPGRATRAVNNSTLRVAWRATAAVPSVNVFVKSGSGQEVQVATSATGGFVDVTLPQAVSDSNHVTVRIQSTATAGSQDSVDGYFMVRGGTPAFTANLSGVVQVGSIQLLEWNGRSDSYLVDLDLFTAAPAPIPIARNLPDFGTFAWLVPDAVSANARIRLTLKNQGGVVVAITDSATFQVVHAPPFTDPTLTSGSSAIRAVHITELRSRIDAARTRYGLQLYPWRDQIVAGVTPVTAQQLIELRTAVTQAYNAARQTPPAFSDANLTAGFTLIQAGHILELRNAVIAIE